MEPCAATGPMPGSRSSVVAVLDDQLKMEDCPELTVEGCATRLSVDAEADRQPAWMPLHPELAGGMTFEPHPTARQQRNRTTTEAATVNGFFRVTKPIICEFKLSSLMSTVFLGRPAKGWGNGLERWDYLFFNPIWNDHFKRDICSGIYWPCQGKYVGTYTYSYAVKKLIVPNVLSEWRRPRQKALFGRYEP